MLPTWPRTVVMQVTWKLELYEGCDVVERNVVPLRW